MMSRPAALSFFALSATTMMALGLARLMRAASWGIGVPRTGRWRARNSSTTLIAAHKWYRLRRAGRGRFRAGTLHAGLLSSAAGDFATTTAYQGDAYAAPDLVDHRRLHRGSDRALHHARRGTYGFLDDIDRRHRRLADRRRDRHGDQATSAR